MMEHSAREILVRVVVLVGWKQFTELRFVAVRGCCDVVRKA